MTSHRDLTTDLADFDLLPQLRKLCVVVLLCLVSACASDYRAHGPVPTRAALRPNTVVARDVVTGSPVTVLMRDAARQRARADGHDPDEVVSFGPPELAAVDLLVDGREGPIWMAFLGQPLASAA
jgi:hypothetical protein